MTRPTAPVRRPLHPAAATALGVTLAAVDALWLRQGAFSMVAAAVLIAVALPASFLPRHRAHRPARLRNVAIWTLCAAAGFAWPAVQRQRLAEQSDAIISAVERYRADHLRYPERLDRLTPGYLPAPADAAFDYRVGPDDAELAYVEMPPFGRRSYSFASKSWTELD